MDLFLDINLIALIFIALFAGFIKGVVGFVMLLIMFSGFIFLSQEEAISLIIIPSLVSNFTCLRHKVTRFKTIFASLLYSASHYV